jgi:hypothetical protein
MDTRGHQPDLGLESKPLLGRVIGPVIGPGLERVIGPGLEWVIGPGLERARAQVGGASSETGCRAPDGG